MTVWYLSCRYILLPAVVLSLQYHNTRVTTGHCFPLFDPAGISKHASQSTTFDLFTDSDPWPGDHAELTDPVSHMVSDCQCSTPIGLSVWWVTHPSYSRHALYFHTASSQSSIAMSLISCCCGCSFSTSAAFTYHSRGCNKNRKHLSNVLTRAQELYNIKKCHLNPDQGTSLGEVSLQDLGSPSGIDSAGLLPRCLLRSASTVENSESKVRISERNALLWHWLIDPLLWQETMDQLRNSEPTSSLPCQDDSLPLSLWQTRWVHRRLPKRFRDMIPEPPQLLPPANLDNLVPSTPTHIPSLQVAHFSTEAESQGLPLSPDQDMDGSDSLAE